MAPPLGHVWAGAATTLRPARLVRALDFRGLLCLRGFVACVGRAQAGKAMGMVLAARELRPLMVNVPTLMTLQS